MRSRTDEKPSNQSWSGLPMARRRTRPWPRRWCGQPWTQTQALHRYLRWRNPNARHPDILAAQRKERARIRSERGIRWGGRPLAVAA